METPYNGPVEISLFDRTALRVVAYWAHEVFREPVRFGRRVDDVMHGSTRFLRLALGLAPALMLAGCGGSAEAPKSSAPPFPGVKISVAAIGEPAFLTTAANQRGEWEASTGASADIAKGVVEPEGVGQAHLILFPAERLGDMIDAGLLIKIPEAMVQPPPKKEKTAEEADSAADANEEEAEDPLLFNDILPSYREQVTKWGSDRFALPYGGSALVLVINRAAFDRDANKEAAKAAGLTLEVPKTWEQLDSLATFFNGRDWSGDGQNDHGIVVAFGADSEGVGTTVFLCRAASLGQHRDHYSLLFDSDTLVPRLTTPPFVEALEKVAAWKALAPPDAATFDAAKARDAFRKGNVAFLIDRAERSTKWGSLEGAKLVGVAPLPGSERVYEPGRKVWETGSKTSINRPSYLPFGGGWLVGVSSKATGTEREAAIDLMKYLVSGETSNRTRSDRAFPMLPVRASQVGLGLPDPRSSPGVEPRSWSDAVSRTLAALKVVPGLRIPHAGAYLADLDTQRVAAIQGTDTPEAALKKAADAWTQRVKAGGLERGLWHYQRSLNSLVTSPEPPKATP